MILIKKQKCVYYNGIYFYFISYEQGNLMKGDGSVDRGRGNGVPELFSMQIDFSV